jgi:hypothetical protein
MIHFRLLPVLVAISLALPLGVASAQPAQENEAALSQEILRYWVGEDEDTQILTGRLPESLPADFPIPQGAQIIGSVVDGIIFTDIFFRVNQAPEEIYSFYQQQLPDVGWQERTSRADNTNSGFLLAEPIRDTRLAEEPFRNFCSISQVADLSITIQPEADSSTVVRLSLVSSRLSEFQDLELFDCPSRKWAPLPNLLPPDDRGGGSSSAIYDLEEAHSRISIETNLDAEALIHHYNSQLEQADWVQIDTGEGGLSRWSIWSFQDEEGESWGGLLVISEVQNTPNEYIGFVQVFKQSPDS